MKDKKMVKKEILVVDDDDNILDVMEKTLTSAGFLVDLCKDGYTGLEKASTGEYRLIILDISLPHVNGLNVLKKIRKKTGINEVPIIMLTSHSDLESVNEAKTLGVSGYIIKPPRRFEVLQRIERVLGDIPNIPPKSFSHTDSVSKGNICNQIQVLNLSLSKIKFSSSAYFPLGTELKEIKMQLFDYIKFEEIVLSIEKEGQFSEDRGEYIYEASLKFLSQENKTKLLKYLDSSEETHSKPILDGKEK